MRLIEYEAKQCLKEAGLAIPAGHWVTEPSGVQAAVADLSGAVLKVQVPRGGRMKAGGIRFVSTVAEAVQAARELLQVEIGGFKPAGLLVEEKLAINREIFLSLTYDDFRKHALILASTSGGIEVEAAAEMIARPFSVLHAPLAYLGREIAAELGFEGRDLLALGRIITRLTGCFLQWDALLLEINPLAYLGEGRFVIADAHIELDDEARERQTALFERCPRSAAMAQPATEFERAAAEIDAADHRGVAGRLVPFEGDLGLLIGGGGASLTIFDAVLDSGGQPANYCEIGGNPSVWKVKALTQLILSQPRVKRLAVLMNVVSNTRVDLVARGVIKGVLEMGLDPARVIAAFRIPGSWEEEGVKILDRYGVPWFGREISLDQVVGQLTISNE